LPNSFQPEAKVEPWGENVFADIEKAGRVQLNTQQREALEERVSIYVAELEFVELMGGEPKGPADAQRKWLAPFIKSLRKTIQVLDARWMAVRVFQRAEQLTLEDALRSYNDEMARLKSLLDSGAQMRNELKKPGPKHDFRLHELLESLEFIFSAAGGTTTALSRASEDELRKSPFIDFAWKVLLLKVPASMRPKTDQALATSWERIRQERHKQKRQKER
jgi:hypothetical protein